MERTRRRFLTASGTALLGVTVGSAGCLSTLPPLGQKIRYGRVDVPESAPPSYRRWLPATSALQPYYEREPDTHVMYGIPGAMGEELLDQPVGITQAFHVGQTDYVGIDYSTFDGALTNDATFVGEKTVDRTVVEATLGETRYERTDSYHGYDLYTRSDAPRALAVGDEAIVNARADTLEAARGRVTTTIDAAAGRIERRHEVDPDFESITDLTGARPFTWSAAPGIEVGESLTGMTSASFDSDSVYFIWDQVYASPEETPSESEIKDHLEGENRPQQSMQTDIEVDGRFLSIEMRQSAEKFRNSASTHTSPHITWGVDYDDDAGRLTFHHEVGEPVPAAQLRIHPEYGYEGDPPFERIDGDFGPGDSITLDLTADAERHYRIQWDAPDGGSSSALFSYDREEQS